MDNIIKNALCGAIVSKAEFRCSQTIPDKKNIMFMRNYEIFRDDVAQIIKLCDVCSIKVIIDDTLTIIGGDSIPDVWIDMKKFVELKRQYTIELINLEYKLFKINKNISAKKNEHRDNMEKMFATL